ncbi:MAG TPA: hypothetical protein VK655_05865 [Solirubrobacteraceae bacterium]|jgi:hypothetical protein|nr:hypothetical protein [Solirubrobacteraceae bacterium]
MTTKTPIKRQTIRAHVDEGASGQLPVLRSNEPIEFRAKTGAPVLVLKYFQQAMPRSPAASAFRLLINAEWHTGPTTALVRDTPRAAQLRELARWSTTEADLDWGHLDQIDRTGWGTTA